MKTPSIKRTLCMSFIALSVMLASCEPEEITIAETHKNLEGSWKIVKAVRNGTDLTNRIDFTQFRLNLNNGGGYTIDNKLPFLVSNNGTWSLDDPAYPFLITFSTEGGENPVPTSFDFPVVAGKRQISLEFSPGCSANSYQYTLERVSE